MPLSIRERIILLFASLALIAPVFASAQTGGASTFVLVLYGVVGFFGAAAVGVFGWGLIVYLTRLGTERREEGIHIMQWGVSILVVVVLLIGLLRFVENRASPRISTPEASSRIAHAPGQGTINSLID